MPFPLDLPTLERALKASGLPSPARIRPFGFSRRMATWILEFPRDSTPRYLVLRQSLDLQGGDPVLTERAALHLAAALGGLPVPQVLRVLPASVLGTPALITTLPPGAPADERVRQGPSPAIAAFQAVGQALTLLGEVPHTGFATRATIEGSFLPRRASWREEVAAMAARWSACAAAWGSDLGPLSERLGAELQEALGALDSACSWGLVHGSLSPRCLRITGNSDLSGIVDWEEALLGDPLFDWGALLHLPLTALARVVEGYGRDAAAALLEDGGGDRLDVYWRCRVLQQLAEAGLPALGSEQGRPRALALELARQQAQLLQGTRAADRLLAAIGLVGATVQAHGPIPEARLRGSRRALEALRWGDLLGPLSAARLVGALSAIALSERAPDPGRMAWERLAEQLIPPVPWQQASPPGALIPDRVGWARDLVGRLLTDKAQPSGGLALALLALGLEAIARLEGAVGDMVLSGLETAVHGLAHWQRLTPSRDPATRLAHAWLGVWALSILPEVGQPEARAQLGRALAREASGAWDDLEIGTIEAESRGDPSEAIAAGPRAEPIPQEAHAALWPALLRAWADGALPPMDAMPGAVLAALG